MVRSDGDGGVGCGGTAAGEEGREKSASGGVESGVVVGVDRVMRKLFGVRRKSPPKNFFGGGGVMVAELNCSGGGEWSGFEDDVCCVKSGYVATNVEWSDIGIQKRKAKLFNEWERFTSDGAID
ncbi:hypothetical protein Tco_0537470 [Tanacetum coccineum]